MVEQWLKAIDEPGSVGATDGQLDAAEKALGIELPDDYCAMMQRVNGGEAELGESYVRFWPVEELAEMNEGYRVGEFRPGLTYFGTNGGGEAFALDWRPNRRAQYVVIPFISLGDEGMIPCGDSLEDFLATLHRGIPFGA